jgi:uncharacterized protein (TIGR02996 family)
MSPDEHALLQAIIASPDDDLPRLVYADWLEENDRSEIAQLIRLDRRTGGNPGGFAGLVKYSSSIVQRIAYLSGSGPEVIRAIPCGIVFFMAWWSGPARQAFAKLRKAIETCDPEGRLLLAVLDVDGVTEDLAKELQIVNGSGETFWVYQGRVVHSNHFGLHTDNLHNYTNHLLTLCTGCHE